VFLQPGISFAKAYEMDMEFKIRFLRTNNEATKEVRSSGERSMVNDTLGKIHIFLLVSSMSLISFSTTSGLKWAYSSEFIVTKTLDTADGSCDASDCSLREAVIAANASAGPDTITLSPGVYTLSITGTQEDSAQTGDLDITDDLILTGNTEEDTVIDGGSIDRVLQVMEGVEIHISHMSLENGQAPSESELLYGGGGIHNRGTLTLSHVRVTNNRATAFGIGGGLFNEGSMTLMNASVSNNQAHTAGGIANTQLLDVTDSTIEGNVALGALGQGGGMFNKGIAEFRKSTMSGNTVLGYNGGGISNTGFLDMTNCTISGNTARVHGGGIFNTNVSALANVTLANNTVSAGKGAGVYNTVEMAIDDTLFSNNLAGGLKANCYASGGGNFTDYGYNLEDANTCGFTEAGGLVNVDPRLGPLQNNGGPTLTHALRRGSPAIDAGNPTGCRDTDVAILNADQRGFERPLDGDGDGISRCDIGAYESDPYAVSKAMPWLFLLLGD
jgi:CSLREA domain-containing protein